MTIRAISRCFAALSLACGPGGATREWKHIDIALTALEVPLYDVTAIFIGRVDDGEFELFVDDVRLD